MPIFFTWNFPCKIFGAAKSNIILNLNFQVSGPRYARTAMCPKLYWTLDSLLSNQVSLVQILHPCLENLPLPYTHRFSLQNMIPSCDLITRKVSWLPRPKKCQVFDCHAVANVWSQQIWIAAQSKVFLCPLTGNETSVVLVSDVVFLFVPLQQSQRTFPGCECLRHFKWKNKYNKIEYGETFSYIERSQKDYLLQDRFKYHASRSQQTYRPLKN